MVIREYKPSDFEEVVQMYYNMCIEAYPHRQFKEKQYFYNNVMRWLSYNYDIMIVEKNNDIVGFSLCYYDSLGGIVEDFYNMECVYIKEQYRKSRALYLIVMTAINYCDKMGLILSGNASDVTESSKISSKYGIKLFTKYERIPNETKNRRI